MLKAANREKTFLGWLRIYVISHPPAYVYYIIHDKTYMWGEIPYRVAGRVSYRLRNYVVG